MKDGCRCCLILVGLLILPSVVLAELPKLLEVGKFSTEPVDHILPDGWNPLLFTKIARHTVYVLIRDEDAVVIRARSEQSASGLTRQVRIDPREFPIIRWRWKIDNLLTKSDARRKEGDDYPARLYITFEYEPDKVSLTKQLKYKVGRAIFGDIPIAALSYIWDSRTALGTIFDNAFTDFVKMVVVRSGPQAVGRWVNEERNIYEDYRKAFNEEPPMINGVAIMTDTDNTKESVTAYYGDILFHQKQSDR